MSSRRKAVKARKQRRKFLKIVIKNYEDQLAITDKRWDVPRSDLERKKSYYENQLHRL